MDTLPTLVYSGETNPIEVDVGSGSYASVELFLSYDANTSRSIVNQVLTQDTTEPQKWKGNLIVPIDEPTGFWQYQIWSTTSSTPPAKEVVRQGTIQVVESFESLNPENLPSKTPNEVELENVEKSISIIRRDMIQSSTISGNNAQRVTLNNLRKERWYLQMLVNQEREAAGRPYLDGTIIQHTTNFLETY